MGRAAVWRRRCDGVVVTVFYCIRTECGKPIYVQGDLPARCPHCQQGGTWVTDRPEEALTEWDVAFLRVNRILVTA
jgi:hypothetical protein